MPRTRTLSVIAPDGSTITRKTHRVYTHAVLVAPTEKRPEWGAFGWCGRPDLAVKASNEAAKFYGPDRVVVVAVSDPDATGAVA